MDKTIMPLTELPRGCKGTVVNVGNYGRGLARRMSDMGLYDGSEVMVISSAGAGPVLMQVNDCTIAVGRGVAKKILVAKEM
ncbi:MAG TPA: FeoA family protein [Bacillota bacterium]|nr:FeoA family protein [Bacillota bacterium]HOK70918.1 FeoA family protein [Bacillota bacterium]HOO31241.1 FeoA family protein [Bacillota bacterium]HPQ02931.1 FeoA family protein [Bacillota bacterium]HPZ14336.1 FeoA family protein [Bacillota bacterium]